MRKEFYLKCADDAYSLQLFDCETLEEAEIQACKFLGTFDKESGGYELPEDCEVY